MQAILNLSRKEVALLMTIISTNPKKIMQLVLDQYSEEHNNEKIKEHIKNEMAPAWDILREYLIKTLGLPMIEEINNESRKYDS